MLYIVCIYYSEDQDKAKVKVSKECKGINNNKDKNRS